MLYAYFFDTEETIKIICKAYVASYILASDVVNQSINCEHKITGLKVGRMTQTM